MCTSPHSDRSSRRGWPARHNVGSWTLMCSCKTSCLGWKRKGQSVFCCKQSLAKDTVCVCVRKIKGKFSNKGGMHGEGSRQKKQIGGRGLGRGGEGRRATGPQHSPGGCQSDRVDYFITWTLGTYFILSLLFLKTKVKQRKPQKGFIFHKVPEITKGGELSSRVTEVQLCFCSVWPATDKCL